MEVELRLAEVLHIQRAMAMSLNEKALPDDDDSQWSDVDTEEDVKVPDGTSGNGASQKLPADEDEEEDLQIDLGGPVKRKRRNNSVDKMKIRKGNKRGLG